MQIAPGILHKYLTGEIMTGDDTADATNINRVFDAITAAHNDTDAKVNSVVSSVVGVGGGTYRQRTQAFIATAGQTVFTLTEGSYTTGNDRLQVFIGGSKQCLDTADFAETSSTSFTLSAGVTVGTKVEASWVEGVIVSATDPIVHASRHAAGGADPLVLSAMTGYDAVVTLQQAVRDLQISFHMGAI